MTPDQELIEQAVFYLVECRHCGWPKDKHGSADLIFCTTARGRGAKKFARREDQEHRVRRTLALLLRYRLERVSKVEEVV